MTIGLISDNHSYIDEKIIQHLSKCDEIWHAGDIGNAEIIDRLEKVSPVIGVYGNVDNAEIRQRFPETLVFTREGLTIAMIHIGGYPGKYRPKARKLIWEHQPDVFISGHSHILKVMKDNKNNLLHLNPGAFGKHGFHTMRTMLRFQINEGKLTDLEVIELGKRGAISTKNT